MDKLLSAYGEGDAGSETSSAEGSSTNSDATGSAAMGATSLRDVAKSMALAEITPAVKDVLRKEAFTTDSLHRELFHNPTYEDIVTIPKGPVQPHKKALGFEKNMVTGFVEDVYIDQHAFDSEYLIHHSALAAVASETSQSKPIIPKNTEVSKNRGGRAGGGQFLGPWARPDCDVDDEEEVTLGTEETAVTQDSAQTTTATTPAKSTETSSKPPTADPANTPPPQPQGEKKEITSIFHLPELYDYQGRTFMMPPTDLKPYPHKCFLPKKWIHTWTGHTKGVACVRLFPRYGHLVLSGGLDNDVKIWDVYNTMGCVRTYIGHQKGVRDLAFNADGTRFLSCSYDRMVKYWDTETGDVIATFMHSKIPYCVKLYPEGGQNEFLAGCADKKILQWDIRTKATVLEYDQHLGAVNTVTFIDQNRRFVSSSDDKSLRIWEWGIPVPIKYISEPHMHSMPAVATHPNGKWFVCQSLDNQIFVYSATDRFKLNRKKRFTGHIAAGFACQLGFSADAHFLISGDGEGKIWFWDWKTCQPLKVIYAHHGVCIGCEWHPIEASRVVTCGWDGKINYWD
ncbi:pre-mRNA-processing factor 17 [Pelomyxa schiedti]|nr:pre-mRNA-processing factor 17 [Pelomyxa schiedti]